MSYGNILHHQQQQYEQQQLNYLLDDNKYNNNNNNNLTINILQFDNDNNNNNIMLTTDLSPNVIQPLTNGKYSIKIAVKSSAHVSYIVGKQGSKIRQIRQETGTFIQTPVNGEEPIFIINGDKENVLLAKTKLEEAANEFDFNIFVEACTYKDNENRIRNNLFLPARYIGLVVGKKGTIIKRIMDISGTIIITPKVNTLNGFKIHGNTEQIRMAINLIKEHILQTTKNVKIDEYKQNQYEITLIINDCYTSSSSSSTSSSSS